MSQSAQGGSSGTERIGRVNCFFEGSYRGKSPVTRRDGTLATARDGQQLFGVRLICGQGDDEAVEVVTLRAKDVPDNVPLDTYVRIPGSVTVTRRGGRVYISKWGNQLLFADGELEDVRRDELLAATSGAE